MNPKNSKISDPHRLLLNLSEKIILKRSDKYVALSILSIYNAWKNVKRSYKNNKFKKYQLLRGMKNLDDLTNRILYQILRCKM